MTLMPRGLLQDAPEPRTLEQAQKDIWRAKMEREYPDLNREYPLLKLLPYQERDLEMIMSGAPYSIGAPDRTNWPRKIIIESTPPKTGNWGDLLADRAPKREKP